MPKQVDHDARRRQLAEALLRVAAARGLEAVSFREVAAEAGVSIGRVQHYFASKEELVLYATGRLRERIEERIARTAGTEPPPPVVPHPLRDLRALLAAFLPLDPHGRTGALAGIAFFHRSLNDPTLAARFREGRARATDAVTGHLLAAAGRGDVGPGADVELEARTLLALVGGLISDLLFGLCTPHDALRVLDLQLARLSGAGAP